MTSVRLLIRMVALVLLCALAVAAGGACGDSDDEETPAAGTGASTSDAKRDLLRARVELRDALYAGDAKRYCGGLTPATRRSQGKAFGTTCEGMVRLLVRRPVKSDPARQAKVVSVKVDGDHGRIETIEPGAEASMVSQFVRRDGRWLGAWRARPTFQPNVKVPDSR